MTVGRKSFIVETEHCQLCGEIFYPPQSCHNYLRLCGRCKAERKNRKLNETRLKKRLQRIKNRKPRKKQIILNLLREGIKTKEELGDSASLKTHISHLRSIGYDIRTVNYYQLVREPNERLVEVV